MSQNEHSHSLLGDHVSPLSLYFKVFGALLFLTFITVWIAQFDFGPLNMFIAMLVATIKATLVGMFFMHLAHDDRLNAAVFGFGLIFLALFFIFTLVDFSGREYVDEARSTYGMDKEKMLELRMEKAQSIQGVTGLPREDVPPAEEMPKKAAPQIQVPGGFEQQGIVPNGQAPEGEAPRGPITTSRALLESD